MPFDRLRRREFITLLGGAAAAWPLTAHAQQPGRLPTIGVLGSGTPATHGQWYAGFVQRLRELRWVEGRTAAIEIRWAEERTERLAEIAAEFVRLKVDVIVTNSATPVLAAMRATSIIPIVFAVANDPLGSGLVTSLGRPGGNVTGLSAQSPDLVGKRLELLREILPGRRRLAIMANVDAPAAVLEMGEVQAAARTLGFEAATFKLRRAEDIAAAWPLAARAQQAGKVARVALILTTSPVAEMTGPEPIHPLVRAFVRTLRILGYVEGQNLVLERRSAEGRFERFQEIVADLVGRGIDVIVTVTNEMAIAAKRVTNSVPIVMVTSSDPVGTGIVASLARPGGNVTGFTINAGPEIEAKRLQLLKEVLPQMARAVFLGTAEDWVSEEAQSVRDAAKALGVTLIHAEHSPTGYADAFALVGREQPDAVFIARNPANFANRQVIIAFMAERRIPSSSYYREFADAGGLMSYGASMGDLFRRAAGQVVKILKGAVPSDLPVEQPTRFELVVSLKTARALKLEISPALLISADEVIE